jgi:ribosomal protein S18 acetylase RimI-like enzyme
MSLQFTTVSSPREVQQILDLQALNHASTLSAEVMADQGFLTVRHDPEVLQHMNEVAPAVIAKDAGVLAGYALVMPREFAPRVPILAPMFDMLASLVWKGAVLRDNPRWFVMGQICVAESYRGQGIFDGLYAHMKTAYGSRYDFTVTEVAERNTRSIRAHERVGFETMHVYPDETTGEVWRVVVLDLQQ